MFAIFFSKLWLVGTQVQGQRGGHCEAKSLGKTLCIQSLQLDAILFFYFYDPMQSHWDKLYTNIATRCDIAF